MHPVPEAMPHSPRVSLGKGLFKLLSIHSVRQHEGPQWIESLSGDEGTTTAISTGQTRRRIPDRVTKLARIRSVFSFGSATHRRGTQRHICVAAGGLGIILDPS